MKLSGIIYENISVCRGLPKIFAGKGCYYSLDGTVLKKLFDINFHPFASNVLVDGMWVSDKERNTTQFFDVFNKDISFSPVQSTFSDVDAFGDNLLASTRGVRKRKLISLNPETGETIEREFLNGLRFTLDKGLVFVRSQSERLVEAYNSRLEKIWEYSRLDGDAYLNFECAPQIYNDLVIINHAYETIALDKTTGEEVWRYRFDSIPTSNVLKGGKIYAVCNAVLYVLNPLTSDVELTQDTGFPVFTNEQRTDRNRIMILPVGNYLYGVAQWAQNDEHRNFRLYNQDCSKVLDAWYPPDYNLNFFHWERPKILDGRIYQPVRSGYAESIPGVMVLELSDSESSGVKVAPRPPVTMLAQPSLNEPHKISVFLDADNLDDMLRYAEIHIEELFYATGYIPFYNTRKNALDRNHNGEIELFVDDSGFVEQGKDVQLQAIAEKLARTLSANDRKAGDKVTNVTFKLTCEIKQKWDMSGEILDWPKIRDREEPLI